jgi:type IV pilus assembly protein PilN
VHMFFQDKIDFQQQRNNLVRSEISAVEAKIKEIEKLEKTKEGLISRMNVIQQLQQSRPQIVRLFDEMLNTLPEGTYLSSLSQSGSKVAVDGNAESNARVSAFMRNVEKSETLTDPSLTVVSMKAEGREQESGRGTKQFKLTVSQKMPKSENSEGGA